MRTIKIPNEEIHSFLLHSGKITLSDKIISIKVVKNGLDISLELDHEKDQFLRLSIEHLDLPIYAFNSLRNTGIATLDELCSYSESHLHSFRNLGKRGIQSIIAALAFYNLKLKE